MMILSFNALRFRNSEDTTCSFCVFLFTTEQSCNRLETLSFRCCCCADARSPVAAMTTQASQETATVLSQISSLSEYTGNTAGLAELEICFFCFLNDVEYIIGIDRYKHRSNVAVSLFGEAENDRKADDGHDGRKCRAEKCKALHC